METMTLCIVLISYKLLTNYWSYDTFQFIKVNNPELAPTVL